jgi:hypothetical protein
VKRNAYRLLVGKPEGKVDNIRMDLGEVGWGDVDRIGLAKDGNRWRAVVNCIEPTGSMKCWETIKWPSI